MLVSPQRQDAGGEHAQTEARERVLDAAERLFMTRGYKATTLSAVASAVGIRTASLYYHAPGGKDQLFVEVVERSLARHRRGLEAAIQAAGSDWTAQLQAAAEWLFSQPAMDLVRMYQTDIPAVGEQNAARLGIAIYESLQRPLKNVLLDAQARGEIDAPQPDLVAASFFSIVQTIHNTPPAQLREPKSAMAAEMIRILSHGLTSRS